jgi:hypothetical protein
VIGEGGFNTGTPAREGAPPVRRRNYGFERRQKAEARRVKQLEKRERKSRGDEPPGPEMGTSQDAGVPVGMWEWFSPSRSRVVTTNAGGRPPEDPPDDWVLLTDPKAGTDSDASNGGAGDTSRPA